jgi:ribosomal protein S18 acetylase RimI-like enzyme
MDTDPSKVLEQFREFLIFCKKRLGLQKLPKIHWHTNDDVGMSRPSFGSFENENQEIKIGINNRHPLDVMRTLAHELTHYKQFLDGKLHNGSGETGSPAENEANAMAGIIMRDWNAAHEEMFKQDEIDEAITLGKKKDSKAAKWIDHMYATLPKNPMNPDQIALVYGEGNDQGLALIELEPDHYAADAASIKWIQAYPQRQGVGRKALADIQKMAAEAGVHLSLTAWKHGKVPERALVKFYKSMGFGKDTKSGQLKWTAPVAESAADDVPQEVWSFIDGLHADSIGKERIDDYVVHFEGFSDWCQQDALERCELPKTDPRHLNKYEDVYDEVIADFIGRESGNKPVASGLAGDELYPVVYAVFRKPVLAEADLNYINQQHEDGGSLEGYVVDTDQPQLMNYLTGQGASPSLVKALVSRYNRIGIIRNMWVDEEIRNGGIGSEMLETAIDDAFAAGADAILLVADMAEDNSQLGKPLDQWYAGWGFKTVGSAGSDPVMVLDRGLNESWSKKYKKSINCSHPKGFSQRAHCAGRRARQAGKHTKSKSVSENFADGKGPGRPGDSQRHGIPKGATIAQLEKAAKAPGRKGQLARWQLNMRRGRAKNESELTENTQLVLQEVAVFHSSAQGNLSKFNSFSHFGTQAAAVDRIKNLVKQKRLSPDTLITIYSVELNIKKPLMIRDYANVHHSAGVYAAALKDKKIIDQDTMVRIRSNNPYDFADPEADTEELAKLWPKYEKNNLAFIKKVLKSKGYDGLIYKNAAEDKGSLSYVILDPNQARITGKKQVIAKDLIKPAKQLNELSAPTIKDTLISLAHSPNVIALLGKEQKINDQIRRTFLVCVDSALPAIQREKELSKVRDTIAKSKSANFKVEAMSYDRAKSLAKHGGYKAIYLKKSEQSDQEPKTEYEYLDGIMPDGVLKITKHFKDRVGERVLDEKWLIGNIKKAVTQYHDKLTSEDEASFVIQDEIAGIALIKTTRLDGSKIYTASTTYGGTLKMGGNQTLLWVGKPRPGKLKVAEDSKLLDKPTPTVGDLAEKYKTSLLAVEQQLRKGVRVEMEHTTKYKVAKEIALDHLSEDLYYYKKLEKVEKNK